MPNAGLSRQILALAASLFQMHDDPTFWVVLNSDAGTLSLIVEADGTASNIRVARSLEPGLDTNAIAAVRKWQFEPGLREGVPVRVEATVQVNSRLPLEQPER